MSPILLLLCVLAGQVSYAQSLAEQMSRTAIAIWPPGKIAGWTYEQAVVLKGVEGVYNSTANIEYLKYIKDCMDYFVDENGEIKTYKPEDYNIDNILGGRMLLTLYKKTNEPKYLKAATTLRNQLNTHPRTAEGGFWHKKRYPFQMWLDGLYMGQPFYAEYAAHFRQDSAFADITRQFVLMESNARDTSTGLLLHGYDESRQQAWANKATGRSANVWARAMGWYGMALVDALEWYPAKHPGRDTLLGILGRFAKAVTAYQDKSGLWWDVVDLAGKDKNYLEASASAMMVYTLYKGVRLKYLPAHYIPVAQKGFNGLQQHFLKNENGQLNLHGTVSVSGLGGDGRRDGSFEYYVSEKVVVNDPKGVGAFIMAANEMELTAPKPPASH